MTFFPNVFSMLCCFLLFCNLYDFLSLFSTQKVQGWNTWTSDLPAVRPPSLLCCFSIIMRSLKPILARSKPGKQQKWAKKKENLTEFMIPPPPHAHSHFLLLSSGRESAGASVKWTCWANCCDGFVLFPWARGSGSCHNTKRWFSY